MLFGKGGRLTLEVKFAWMGIGVGFIGALVGFLAAAGATRSQGSLALTGNRRRALLSAGLTVILTLIFWLVSMKKTVPFSLGQTLGYGFLIGGLSGALAGIIAFKLEMSALAHNTYRNLSNATNSLAFFGILAVSIVFLLFHNYPQMALAGFAIGTAMAAIIRHYLQNIRSEQTSPLIERWAIFTITLTATILLSIYHFDKDSQRIWWTLPILVGATVCIANYIAIEIGSVRRFAERTYVSYSISLIIAAVLVIGTSAVFSFYLVHNRQLLETVALGVGIFVLIVWLIASHSDDIRAGLLEASSASILLIVAGAVAAFKVWAGLGMGLALIAAEITLIPATGIQSDRRSALSENILASLALGLSIVLFRLFIEVYRVELGSADLRIHYTFVGALLGAIAPFVFISSMMRLGALSGKVESTSADVYALLGTAMIGLFAAASPLLLFAIWQIKAVLGFVFGLITAQAFLLFVRSFEASHERTDSTNLYSISLLTIGAQLVAIQFMRPLIEWESSRMTRIWILAVIAAIAVIWLFAAGIAARRSAR